MEIKPQAMVIPKDTSHLPQGRGLHPAVIDGTNRIAPLTIAKDLDERGWLAGVTTFNLRPHLPHYAITTGESKSVRVLARQPIDLSRPHPFTLAGNLEFNTLVWLPPSGDRAGDVLVVDSTRFSSLFGTDKSLERFWRNIATLPAPRSAAVRVGNLLPLSSVLRRCDPRAIGPNHP
jgi:hypothetical protein